MAAKSLRETDQFQMGRRGERVVKSMYQSLGYWVIPSYDYAGPDGDMAPSLQSNGRWLPLPDLDTSRGGKRRWIEVKTKKHPTFHEMTRQWEEGIDLDKYQRYLDVQSITGAEIWLAFYELDTRTVLHQSLDHLAGVVRIYDGDKMGPHGMAFFPRTELLLLGTVRWTGGMPRFELASEAPKP